MPIGEAVVETKQLSTYKASEPHLAHSYEAASNHLHWLCLGPAAFCAAGPLTVPTLKNNFFPSLSWFGDAFNMPVTQTEREKVECFCLCIVVAVYLSLFLSLFPIWTRETFVPNNFSLCFSKQKIILFSQASHRCSRYHPHMCAHCRNSCDQSIFKIKSFAFLLQKDESQLSKNLLIGQEVESIQTNRPLGREVQCQN